MKIKLISHTPNPETAIIQAAANCWRSVPHQGILGYIIKAGHWTPLEFANFHFEISDVSRVLTHQLVGKRVGEAFAQESQRYVDLRETFDYVVPGSIKGHDGAKAALIYHRTIKRAYEGYRQLLDAGIPAEDAQYVLPGAVTSTIHMTINYHALLDLAKERLCSKAQWEIRELLERLKVAVTEVSPKLGGYLQPKCYWLGRCPEKSPCGKMLNKQTPRKPKEISGEYSYFVCGACGESIEYSDAKETHKYCLNCGQMLDWGGDGGIGSSNKRLP